MSSDRGPSRPADEPAGVEHAFAHTRPRRGSDEVDAFLRAVVKTGASDFHAKAGQSPRVRIGGRLRKIEREAAPNEEFEARVLGLLSDEERQTLVRNGSVDFAYDLAGEARFRINVYRQETGLSLAARLVPREIPSFEDLHLPPVVERAAEMSRGLVLVAGTTGSGKSSTIAALLERINQTRHDHIVTIEDPIEFLYECKKSLVDQREVGINVPSFELALRALLREDPDVVLIGEMRDAETFRSALQAADTGHLVFSTVHAANAPQTIARLINLFPLNEQPMIRQSLVLSLQAVISQKLIPSCAEGVSRVPAVEVLIATPIVRKLISEGKEAQLGDVIRTREEGMLGYAECLVDLHNKGLIDPQTGSLAAPNKEEFERLLAGIETTNVQFFGG
ncbi:MAG: PilT/PilU family type 4a pilus ATPase [Planctomycetales bacterium]|nr:PilT/PilU family type 4a pilus ATPase [Planctomycetales bacterium]